MITIYGIDEKLNPIKAKISDILHECMMNALGLPEDKRAHRFIPLDHSNFYYPGGRSAQYTVIEINMISGRSKETIKKLIHSIFQQLEAHLSIKPIDIEITISEQPAHCWGFRGITGDDAQLNYAINV